MYAIFITHVYERCILCNFLQLTFIKTSTIKRNKPDYDLYMNIVTFAQIFLNRKHVT